MWNKKDLLAIFALLMLTLVFFNQVLFGDKIFVYRDFFRLIYPLNHFVYHSIRKGEFPLWNPYLSCGTPVITLVVYPLSIIITLFPFNLGLNLFILFHYFLAGLFMYLFLRELKITPFGSIIGGLTFSFSGYLLSCIDLTLFLVSITWMPLIFLFINRAIDLSAKSGLSRGLWYFILAGVAIALQFLGGTPEIVYINGIVLFLFLLAKCFNHIRPIRAREIKRLFQILLGFLFMGLVSTGLALFKFLPFLELLNYSKGSSILSYQQATHYSLLPYELVNLIIPSFSNLLIFILPLKVQTYVISIYMGILPLLFIGIAIFYHKKAQTLFWITISLGALILSFGKYTFFYQILYRYFPFFSMIRYPVKFFSWVIFSGAVLTGFGFTYLQRAIDEGSCRCLKLIYIFNITLLLLWAILSFSQSGIVNLLNKTSTNITIERLNIIYATVLEHLEVTILFIILGTLLIYFFKKKIIGKNLFSCLIVFILITDLFSHGIRLIPLVKQEFYSYESETLKLLKEDKDCFRIFLDPKTKHYLRSYNQPGFKSGEEFVFEAHLLLISNLPLLHRIFEASSDVIRPGVERYHNLLWIAERYRLSALQPLLNLLNIKYIISKFEIPSEGLRLIYHHPETGVRLYLNSTYLPRAFILPEAGVIKEKEKILERLFDPEFDPTRQVILEEELRG